MIGPSRSGAGRTQRNRWSSPRQVQLLDALWSARLRRAGRRPRPERSREERLRHFAEIVGHAVGSCRELSWREANRVIHRLLEEVRSSGPTPSSAATAKSEPASARRARERTMPSSPRNSPGKSRRSSKSVRSGGPRNHDPAKYSSE